MVGRREMVLSSSDAHRMSTHANIIVFVKRIWWNCESGESYTGLVMQHMWMFPYLPG